MVRRTWIRIEIDREGMAFMNGSRMNYEDEQKLYDIASKYPSNAKFFKVRP